MKSTLRLGLIGLLVLVLGCKLDDLPREKRLKECVKPAGTITATVDPTNYLKYTFTLSNLTGDVDNVVWTINGQPSQPIPKNQTYSYPFPQAGNFNISVSLQNGCANNTTLQSSVSVTPVPPAVSTGQVVGVGPSSASVQLTLTSLGSSASLTEYGVVYAEAPNNNPTLENAFPKSIPGTLSLNLPTTVTITTNLKPGTRYFYKAYVRYGAGQPVYGQTVNEFTTTAAIATSKVFLFGGSNFDFGYFMVPTPDGGGIFTGNSASGDGDVTGNKGGYDAWVGRFDAKGIFYWRTSLGGSATDNLRSVQFTSDRNLILVGSTNSNDKDLLGLGKGEYDIWVVKMNAESGAVIWQKTFGGTKSDVSQSVQATADGGCVFVGNTNSNDGDINTITGRKGGSDIWVVKLNSSGDIQWQYAYGGSGEDIGNSVRTTSDGGYIVAGRTNSTNIQVSNPRGANDGWIIKLDASGTLIRQQSLGGAGDDESSSVQQTLDGGYIVVGSIAAPGTGKRNVSVTKLNSSLQETGTSVSFGSPEDDDGHYIEQLQDGSYILVATARANGGDVQNYKGGDSDIWVLKLSSNLSIEWRKPIGGSGTDFSYCIRPVSDGFWLVGSTNSTDVDGKGNKGNNDVMIVKLNAQGEYQ